MRINLQGRQIMKKIILIACIGILLLGGLGVKTAPVDVMENEMEKKALITDDIDPLVDIAVTVDILAIRTLDIIDNSSDPDFFIKIFINDEEFISSIWKDTNYLYDCWSVTKNVLDDVETANIKIQLWDNNSNGDSLCDISMDANYEDIGFDADLIYNLKTGHWHGSDQIQGDPSGYGRLNGCDDGSVYKNENDCELWFNVYQEDFDNDGIPYWTEVNVYGTDPEICDLGRDDDNDGIPIEWEHKWGYDPLISDDHQNLDSDNDSLSNIEEYLTSDFGSDPYRQDVFLEIDYMEDGPNGEKSILPELTKEILKNPFHRRNIVFHVDTGEINGGELIPFDDKSDQDEILKIYRDYFTHNNESNWRRGVFHYGIIVNLCNMKGYAFSGDTPPYWGYIPGTNGFVISSSQMEKNTHKLLLRTKTLEYLYASAIMHETGHNFGIRFGEPFGCDCWIGKYPWQICFWFIRNYKSIMNYQYTYSIFDYSDGSHGRGDYDDWANIDLTYFEAQ